MGKIEQSVNGCIGIIVKKEQCKKCARAANWIFSSNLDNGILGQENIIIN